MAGYEYRVTKAADGTFPVELWSSKGEREEPRGHIRSRLERIGRSAPGLLQNIQTSQSHRGNTPASSSSA